MIFIIKRDIKQFLHYIFMLQRNWAKLIGGLKGFACVGDYNVE